jgi:hypothetical protein
MKMISGKEVPSVKTRFTVTMTTVPHNQFNKYGIVITNVLAENLEQKQFRKEYKREIRQGNKLGN